MRPYWNRKLYYTENVQWSVGHTSSYIISIITVRGLAELKQCTYQQKTELQQHFQTSRHSAGHGLTKNAVLAQLYHTHVIKIIFICYQITKSYLLVG